MRNLTKDIESLCCLLQPIVCLVAADSWYCRTAAADLLARLATDAAGRKALKAHAQHAGAALLATLRLPHKSQARLGCNHE